MVKQPPTPQPETSLKVTRDDARRQIQARIDLSDALLANVAGDGESAIEKYKVWTAFNTQMLRKLFSDDSIQTEYDRWQGNMRIGDVHNNYRRSMQAKTSSLRAILGRIELFDEPQSAIPVGPRLANTGSDQVFIVHGHDNEIKMSVTRLVEGLGLKAVILHEQPDGGKTIIEKLETLSASAAYAVVLLTPDDFGHVKDKPEASKARARQNVILELGLFIGLIGRARVCALVKGELERPSDIDGVVYTPIDAGGSWKFRLAKELQAAGLKVDMNDVR